MNRFRRRSTSSRSTGFRDVCVSHCLPACPAPGAAKRRSVAATHSWWPGQCCPGPRLLCCPWRPGGSNGAPARSAGGSCRSSRCRRSVCCLSGPAAGAADVLLARGGVYGVWVAARCSRGDAGAGDGRVVGRAVPVVVGARDPCGYGVGRRRSRGRVLVRLKEEEQIRGWASLTPLAVVGWGRLVANQEQTWARRQLHYLITWNACT